MRLGYADGIIVKRVGMRDYWHTTAPTHARPPTLPGVLYSLRGGSTGVGVGVAVGVATARRGLERFRPQLKRLIVLPLAL